MNDFRAFLLAIILAPVMVFVIPLGSIAAYNNYQRSFVDLPHGFYLKEHRASEIQLHDPKGNLINKNLIWEFNVSGDIVYGFIDAPDGKQFFLDTKNNHFEITNSEEKFNLLVKKSGYSKLEDSSKFTFWDITSGHKTATWE